MLTILILWFLVPNGLGSENCRDRAELYASFQQTITTGNSVQSIKHLEELEASWVSCGLEKDSVYAKILHTLGWYYWENGDPDAGITFTKKAIGINSSGSKSVAEKELCNSYFILGASYGDKGSVRECLEAYNQSVLIGSRYPEKTFIVSKVCKELANVHFGQGDIEKSLLLAEKGFLIGKQLNDRALMAANLIEKAQAHIELGALEEAAHSLDLAISLDKDFIRLAAAYSLYAELNIKENRFEEAVSDYQKSFLNFKKGGFDIGCGQSSVNLGYHYAERMGKYDLSIRYYQQALAYFHEPHDKAIVLNSLADVKSKMGLPEEALVLNHEALCAFFPNFKDKSWKENPKASAIRLVVDKINLLSVVIGKGDILLQLSQTKGKKETLNYALSTYMLADTMVDFMRWEHTGRASKLFWREKTRALYENAIKTCFELNDPEKAFYFFEKSRAAILHDQINELGAAELLSLADQEKENGLKEKTRLLRRQLAVNEEDVSSRSKLRKQLLDAEEALDQFVRRLETTNPSYYAYKYDNRVPAVHELRQNLLAPGQAYLAYFFGENTAFGFFCDAKGSKLIQLDLQAYQKALPLFLQYLEHKTMQNNDFGGYLDVSNRLFKLLIEPFDIGAGTRLVISPDGQLLPFAAFSRSASREDFLIRSNPISYTYSASFLSRTGRKERPWYRVNSFFGMAPVHFDAGLNQTPLPGSDKALQQLDKGFIFSKILENQKATKNAFLENIANYPIVQLFTHAAADTLNRSSSPTLYFADSTLSLGELVIPFANSTELVVLSACETGIGVDRRGEGVMSLARGFAGTGVPSTLTTLWKVETGAVYRITRYFYEGIDQELPLDVALQKAQLRWLDEGEKSDELPYIWAGNVLLGHTDSIRKGLSPFILWIVMISGLALFGLFYLANRKPKLPL